MDREPKQNDEIYEQWLSYMKKRKEIKLEQS